MQRRTFVFASAGALALPAFAHHGWSSFDQGRPIYLEGRARKVVWRNPHVEFDLEVADGLKLPADLAKRAVPAQSSPVEGARLLAAATLPTRRDKTWHIECAPLTRMQAWNVAEIKDGDSVAMLGFTFAGEKGDAILRVEYLFVGDRTYGLRSSPV
jgi:Family of unknown function (DUF6152)